MGEKMELYLKINEKKLKDTREKAKNNAISEDEILYPVSDLDTSVGEFYFDDSSGCIEISGNFSSDSRVDDELGYLSLSIPLSTEMLLDIIESYRKKLAKVKTVMEAIK